MGTHPIFESDFDCLTDDDELAAYCPEITNQNKKKRNKAKWEIC